MEETDREQLLRGVLSRAEKPEQWDDDWVRETKDAVKEYLDCKEHKLKAVSYPEKTPFNIVAYNLELAKNASQSQRENLLKVCQQLCEPEFLCLSSDSPMATIVGCFCKDPQQGERNPVHRKVLDMAMSSVLETYNINWIWASLSGKFKVKKLFPLLQRFVEVVITLKDAFFLLLKNKIPAGGILYWWTKALVTMQRVPFGHLIRNFILELFLNDIKTLHGVDFDNVALKEAFDSLFPGTFNNYHWYILPLARLIVPWIGDIPVEKKGFLPGSFQEKDELQKSVFSYMEKSGMGHFLINLVESPDVMTTQQGRFNVNIKKFVETVIEAENFKKLEIAAVKWSIQGVIDQVTIEKKTLDLILSLQKTLDGHGIQCENRAFITLVNLANQHQQVPSSSWEKDMKATLEKLEQEVSSNWMGRNSIHLLALICHEKEVFEAVAIACPDFLHSLMNCKDVHATSPYLLSCACKNEVAKEFFLKNGATPGECDSFGNTDEELQQQTYLFWVPERQAEKIALTDIDYTLHDREMSIRIVKDFFRETMKEVVKSNEILEASIEIVGSVREQTKVGQMDEFDVQILFTRLSERIKEIRRGRNLSFDNSSGEEVFMSEAELRDTIEKSMLKIQRVMDYTKVPLRVVYWKDPWKMIYEGNGKSKGMLISFDVVPVIEVPEHLQNGDLLELVTHRQGKILRDPIWHPQRSFLKRSKLDPASFKITFAKSERDIVDCLPVEVRLGVVMVKSLLRQQEDCPITSYMVKNALFYEIEDRITKGEMQKLTKPDSTDRWINNSIAKDFHGEGRRWAIDILRRIKLTKQSFLDEESIKGIDDAASFCDYFLGLLTN